MPSSHTPDWQNLQALAAIAQEGSIAGAARALGMAHSSVLRRLNQLEATLHTQLVHRHRGGATLTQDGAQVAARAQAMAAQARGIHQSLHTAIRGHVRLAFVDGAAPFVMPAIRALRAQHPALTFTLLRGENVVDLKRGDADIALRIAVHTPPPDLIGRPHGTLRFAAYAHARSVPSGHLPVAAHETSPFQTGDWAVLHDGQAGVPQAIFERAHIAPTRRFMHVNSSALVHRAVRHEGFRGILACAAADPDPALVRLTAPLPALDVPLWTLCAKTLADVPRIRVVRRALTTVLKELGPVLRGERPDAADAAACIAHAHAGLRGEG